MNDLESIFLRSGRRTVFKKYDTVFFQGEAAEQVGLITNGRLEAKAYSVNGEETWLGQFKVGDLIGHVSLFSKSELRFNFICATPVTIIFMKSSTLTQLFNKDPILAQGVVQDLAIKLDTLTMRLIEAYTLSAKGRICAELIRMSARIGKEPDKAVIRPNPVFVDLALRVNSTRETVSRSISQLQKAGILSREPGAILIHNPEALKSAVQ